MPFKSQAQRGFMYTNHPKIAKKFEAATLKGKKLPYHVKKKSKKIIFPTTYAGKPKGIQFHK
jgi:hypothetical protein